MSSTNSFGKLCRVQIGNADQPTGFVRGHARGDRRLIERHLQGVTMMQGSQILRLPEGSTVSNITLCGGASFRSQWACLRAATLEFYAGREIPVHIDGNGFEVPSAFMLVDLQTLYRVEKRNPGIKFPYSQVGNISEEEPFFMIHSSFCDPDRIFVEKGSFLRSGFLDGNVRWHEHMKFVWPSLFLEENRIEGNTPFDITAGLNPKPLFIFTRLSEGGIFAMSDKPDVFVRR